MKQQTKTDVKALCFFVETVLHLNPTRMDNRTCQSYQAVIDRVREDIQKEPEV